MSRERLEEIIEKGKRSDEYAEKGLWEASDGIIVHLHNEGYINYLIERVQELEETAEDYKTVNKELHQRGRKVRKQNKRYQEALEFYADKDEYYAILNLDDDKCRYGKVYLDEGRIAREALDERSNR